MLQKCKVKPLGTHPETKPTNSSLRNSSFIYLFGFHLCQGNKTTLSFFYLEPLYSATWDFPLVGAAPIPRTYPRGLRTEATAFPLELLFLCLRNLPDQ